MNCGSRRGKGTARCNTAGYELQEYLWMDMELELAAGATSPFGRDNGV